MYLNARRWGIAPLWVLGVLGANAADSRLAEAARNRDAAAVRSLLKQHADLNSPEPDGATAIAWAAHWDDVATATLLIGAGANVNLANDNGVTPLWLACSHGSAQMVEKLLAAGADPAGNGLPAGETPLLRCSASGNVASVNALLARGADPNIAEKSGQTPLMWALGERHPDVAKTLIEHGADVNAISKGGFTPLLFAAQQGEVESGRLLLERGANAKVMTRDGLSPLLLAINSGREQFAILLVQKGADPNVTDRRGINALHYTMQKGLSILIGAVHDAQYGSLDSLFRPNMNELISVMLEHGANPNARLLKRVVQLRISDRPKIDLIGTTPFLVAAASGDVESMNLLLAKGADPKLTTRDRTTPLMAAAGVGRAEDRTPEEEKSAVQALDLLVKLGADVNAANANGFTAMHGASYTGANEIIQFLADNGAILTARDKRGETPLSMSMGDPNGLADDFSRRIHVKTEILLRKLMHDDISLSALDQRPNGLRSGSNQ